MEQYREQHKKRLTYMPWLFQTLKPAHKQWAQQWQEDVQAHLISMETVILGEGCFIAPEANIFAEPGRDILVGDHTHIAANCFLHGPLSIGKNVGINQSVILDGGRAGIHIGDNTRIAANTAIYAFNHGIEPDRLIREQAVNSKGIHIGKDVWIGAHVSIVDGVTIGDGAVIGMGSVVTKDVNNGEVVAGNPARRINQR